jgi:hypothetical protein
MLSQNMNKHKMSDMRPRLRQAVAVLSITLLSMIANESFHDFFIFAALSSLALLVFLVVNVFQKVRQTPKLRSVAILVLGDVGRSPRMMYHAESFAKLGFDTHLIGYKGEDCWYRICSD